MKRPVADALIFVPLAYVVVFLLTLFFMRDAFVQIMASRSGLVIMALHGIVGFIVLCTILWLTVRAVRAPALHPLGRIGWIIAMWVLPLFALPVFYIYRVRGSLSR